MDAFLVALVLFRKGMHANVLSQGCQIVLVYDTKTEKCTKRAQNVPNVHKISRMSLKIFQRPIKYINIFQSMALKNIPKLGFLV
jgi:hypothetical protein